MSDDVKPSTATEHACEMSLEEHLELAVAALTMFGLGLACETEYKALLVIAEISKQMHGHPEFDPKPAAAEWVAECRALQAKIDQQREEMATLDVIFPAPDNGQIH